MDKKNLNKAVVLKNLKDSNEHFFIGVLGTVTEGILSQKDVICSFMIVI